MPFAASVAIFVLAFAGLAYSLFPYVVMDRMTIWEAASHPSALKFVLVGVIIVVPFLIAYTAFAYACSAARRAPGCTNRSFAVQPSFRGASVTSTRRFAARP